nr:UvrABC system C [Ipomoea batatas]
MSGGKFFLQRVLNYVINEFVVDRLANSHSFQRFAVRTSRTLDEVSKLAEQKKREIAEQIKDASKNFEVGFCKLQFNDSYLLHKILSHTLLYFFYFFILLKMFAVIQEPVVPQ